MLTFLDCPEPVLAFRAGGKIENADLSALFERLEPMLERGGPVHVFAQIEGLSGLALDGFPAHVARAMPLLAKLPRFGRIAVVADQAWLRLAARIESAVLPGISYRTFTPEQRDAAFAWVRGNSA